MHAYKSFINTVDRLLGPGGCPWDQSQTLLTLRETLLEETHEVLDAINSGDSKELQEELGDLAFNVAFLCKVAEREGKFTEDSVYEGIKDKLIRRHPHIFASQKQLTEDELKAQWDKIKQEEKGHIRKSALDGIPSSLPSLAKAQMFARKLKVKKAASFKTEQELAQKLYALCEEAQSQGFNAESSLAQHLKSLEQTHRQQEECSTS